MFQLDTEFPPLISSITELSHLMTVFNRWVVVIVMMMVVIIDYDDCNDDGDG